MVCSEIDPSYGTMAEFPAWSKPLFEPHRYKIALGGRGGAKSWAYARALLLRASQGKLRWLCAREVQKSVDESVHQLLSDQIAAMGLSKYFRIKNTEIEGVNGSLFSFCGLLGHTILSIKSYEGYDGVWVEEGQGVSRKSWEVLTPTFRVDGSEVWITMNPDTDTDPTYEMFVSNPRTDTVIMRVNYMDNPWFNKVLEQERLDCLRDDPKGYKNIWLGECKAAVTGAIYADEAEEIRTQNRICRVPADPLLRTHVVFDLGWNDSMAIILAQRMAGELRIIEYIEDSHKTLDYYSSLLRERKHNWGTMWLPHDGDHKDYKTGKSAKEVMQALQWPDVQIIPVADVEEGIRNTRMALRRMVFDKENTVGLVECIKRYKRHIPTSTGEATGPVHDKYSHGADALRYLATIADRLSNESWGAGSLAYPKLGNA